MWAWCCARKSYLMPSDRRLRPLNCILKWQRRDSSSCDCREAAMHTLQRSKDRLANHSIVNVFLKTKGRRTCWHSLTVAKLTFTAAESKQFVNLKICGRLFWVQMTLFSNICTAAVSSIAVSLEAAPCMSSLSILFVHAPVQEWTQPNSSDNRISFGQLLPRRPWR